MRQKLFPGFINATKTLRWLILGVFVVGLFWLEKPQSVPLSGQRPFISLDVEFESEQINDQVFANRSGQRAFREEEAWTEALFKKEFKRNALTKAIHLGASYHNRYGWVYFDVCNTTSFPQKIVIETPHSRCDGLTAYTASKGQLRLLSEIKRQTPLSLRAYPFEAFALPFSIVAHDTMRIVLRSERLIGINELNLRLTAEAVFLKKVIIQSKTSLFKIAFCFTLMLFVLVLGGLFKQMKLFYYGIYLGGVTQLYLSANYFYDTFPFPSTWTLQAPNSIHFFGFLCNILFHLFFYQLIKHTLRQPKRYFWGAGILVVLNGLALLAFLWPISQINFLITNGLQLLVVANMSWILYHIWRRYEPAFLRYLILLMLAFLPTVFQIVTNFLGIYEGEFTYDIDFLDGPVALFGVAIFAIAEFRNELILKQTQAYNLDRIKQDMDALRRAEIETVGRNLHDQVGNTLASALGYLNMKQIQPTKVKDLILNAINQLRFISHNLVKDDSRLLSEKVTSLIGRFNDFSTTNFIFNDFSHQMVDALPVLTQQNIYNIIQEVLSNIIKHAQATEASVQFFANGQRLQISIEDDGIGFDTKQVFKGIGIQNIYKRGALSALKIVIDSTSDGTSVIIETDYEDKRNDH